MRRVMLLFTCASHDTTLTSIPLETPQISMDDWLQGIQLQRFPVSHEEAVRMFKAIDVNHDNCTHWGRWQLSFVLMGA